MIDWRAFGRQLHIVRRDHDLTQEQLAKAVVTSRNHINLLECGKIAKPGYPVIERICTLLGMELPRSATND